MIVFRSWRLIFFAPALALIAGCITTIESREVAADDGRLAARIEAGEVVSLTLADGTDAGLHNAKLTNDRICGELFLESGEIACCERAEVREIRIGERVTDWETMKLLPVFIPACILTLPLCLALGIPGG